MEKRALNPATWLLNAFNVNEAIEVTGGQRVLYVSGQTSTDEQGAILNPGDMLGQFKQAWANLNAVLAGAGMTPGSIVRLNFYTTDVDAFMGAAAEIVPLFASAGCTPVSTLLGVTRLFDPGIMLEIEATAVA